MTEPHSLEVQKSGNCKVEASLSLRFLLRPRVYFHLYVAYNNVSSQFEQLKTRVQPGRHSAMLPTLALF